MQSLTCEVLPNVVQGFASFEPRQGPLITGVDHSAVSLAVTLLQSESLRVALPYGFGRCRGEVN